MLIEWKISLTSGKNVKVQIKPQYANNNTMSTSFEVDYWINGEHTFKNIINK